MRGPAPWYRCALLGLCAAVAVSCTPSSATPARAHAVTGDREEAEAWKARATEAAEATKDPEERDIIMGDVATLP